MRPHQLMLRNRVSFAFPYIFRSACLIKLLLFFWKALHIFLVSLFGRLSGQSRCGDILHGFSGLSAIPFVLVSVGSCFFASRSILIHPLALLYGMSVFVVDIGVGCFCFLYFNLRFRGLGWDGKSFTWSF